jgi:GNAT superfamily N-acetyltransferase
MKIADFAWNGCAGLLEKCAGKEGHAMTGVTFRRARAADLPAIIVLLADDGLGRKREDTGSPPNPKYLDAFQVIDADPNQLQAVAVLENEVIGTLQLTFIPGLTRQGAWRGQIEGVRVAATHRGSGVGQQMFEWAIAQCRARGCSLVQLTTDKQRGDAHRFYDRLGFVGSHIGYKLTL